MSSIQFYIRPATVDDIVRVSTSLPRLCLTVSQEALLQLVRDLV